MIVSSEKEARERWCPFARVFVSDCSEPAACNRYGSGEQFPNARCIGSKCMAWRWVPDPDGIKPNSGRGYCGLAGVPVA
jgi:hypothetical protein